MRGSTGEWGVGIRVAGVCDDTSGVGVGGAPVAGAEVAGVSAVADDVPVERERSVGGEAAE